MGSTETPLRELPQLTIVKNQRRGTDLAGFHPTPGLLPVGSELSSTHRQRQV